MAMSDEDKKKMIVKEIESWRRGKMLPDQYCDFLQNLYLDDLDDRPRNAMGAAVRKIGQASGKAWILVFGIFALSCLFVLHFSAFPLAMQIAFTGLGTAGFITGGAWWRDKLPLRSFLFLGASVIYLLVAGISLLRLHGWTAGGGPILLLMACALIWIVCGVGLRVGVLHAVGWLAIIVLYSWMLARQIPNATWAETQVFWVPASLLFGWLSWFTHVKLRSAGGVLLAIALVLWFMPEVYSALYHIDTPWIQVELAVKTVILGIGMYRLRKQWMEWVV
ncbi:hypothetical protein [Cohnella zeiphila]|uniref:DUF2157 domain-containing protein n=1 Tax=Cohnella zeiphila TaxID=2761120 RepID=A0A7X0SGR7_9BACL|nr:hypothetical protein [Cohnella zeiphila]MBB6729694.1 hypothetical protein [Cohnella zeiphila]